MKRCCFRAALACLALVACAAGEARAQGEEDSSRIQTQTATLFSQITHQDYDRASFSFELGVLGDEKLPERRAYYDLRFGGVRLDEYDWFDTARVRDSRSQLKDLGELNWSNVYDTPLLFASATPHTGAMSYSSNDRKELEISPANVNVRAIAGHMYVLHVKDEKSDFYVMFRVESVKPEDECTISWRRVPSPDADQPTADK